MWQYQANVLIEYFYKGKNKNMQPNVQQSGRGIEKNQKEYKAIPASINELH